MVGNALAAGLLMASLLSGCFEPSGGTVVNGRMTIRTAATDHPIVKLRSERRVIVAVTMTNYRRQPVFMVLCGTTEPAFQLEKRVGDEWQLAFQPVCPMIFSAPRRVESGATVRHLASIAVTPGGSPRLSPDEMPGRYRMVYGFLSAAGGRSPGSSEGLLPLSERTSNEFAIVE